MRVALVATNGFDDRELAEARRAIEAAGHRVELVAPSREMIEGDHGRLRLAPDVSIDDADPDDYDALLVPGGRSPDRLRADGRFVRFAARFEEKPVFAICHGPQLLFTAGLLEGRRVTAARTVQYDLSRAGIEVEDEPLVMDERLVTARHGRDLPLFCEAMVRTLEREPAGAHAT